MARQAGTPGTNGKFVPLVIASDAEGNILKPTGNSVFFEDDNFISGDSPVMLNLNTALGRNAVEGSVINDGPGDLTVEFSNDGESFGDEIRTETQEQIDFDEHSVHTIRITHVADSAYRVVAK